jgi:hypothetical protein
MLPGNSCLQGNLKVLLTDRECVSMEHKWHKSARGQTATYTESRRHLSLKHHGRITIVSGNSVEHWGYREWANAERQNASSGSRLPNLA